MLTTRTTRSSQGRSRAGVRAAGEKNATPVVIWTRFLPKTLIMWLKKENISFTQEPCETTVAVKAATAGGHKRLLELCAEECGGSHLRL